MPVFTKASLKNKVALAISTTKIVVLVLGFPLLAAVEVNAQTVVIPKCPSVSEIPKKGILDAKKEAKECEETDTKGQSSTPKKKVKKPKKS